MTTIAHVTGDGNAAEFERVIAAFDEDFLVAVDSTNPPPDCEWGAEIRTDEAEVLSRIHQICVKRGIDLDILRIRNNCDG
jgi:hypothetical protein